ncbi:hypothetical protein CDCA_CDCA07G2050 [Cyanidium caldarium]|uniref:Uncharacterized protein n=1 Tax=Cyanidium caldarium TaxID=2771 RepID=A0AAV9IVA5_CYACA|nr:hypothetical protein CDCA_CDCA07G2050 [Cyanidium caldarium]
MAFVVPSAAVGKDAGVLRGSYSAAVWVDDLGRGRRRPALAHISRRPQRRAARPFTPLVSRAGEERVNMKTGVSGNDVLSGPYEGRFGEWYLTRADVDEVQAYRRGMAVTAAAAAVAAVALLADVAGSPASGVVWDAAFWMGVVGLGRALQNIHIYLAPIHRFLKALYVVGVGGSAAVTLVLNAQSVAGGHGLVSLAEWLAQHPIGWLAGAGWCFVALTGIFFKEAFCFGRAEALGLTILTPLLVGGHFAGLWRTAGEPAAATVAVVAALLFGVFAVHKFEQAALDDLGDKSVFEYLRRSS